MKKLFYLPAALLLTLAACSSDDSSTVPAPAPSQNLETLVQARWNMTEYHLSDATSGEPLQSLTQNGDCTYFGYIELRAEGRETIAYYNANKSCAETRYPGSWKVDSTTKELTITVEDSGMVAAYRILSVDNNSMELQVIHEGGVKPEDNGVHLRVMLKK